MAQLRSSKTSINSKTSSLIVGIGTAVEGLEARESFFPNNSSNTKMAFVVIQHLDPHHKLFCVPARKTCENEHQEFEDEMKVELNTLYLNPLKKNVTFLILPSQIKKFLIIFRDYPTIVIPTCFFAGISC